MTCFRRLPGPPRAIAVGIVDRSMPRRLEGTIPAENIPFRKHLL